MMCVRQTHQSFLVLPVHCQMTVMKSPRHHHSPFQSGVRAEVPLVLKFILKRMQRHMLKRLFAIQVRYIQML